MGELRAIQRSFEIDSAGKLVLPEYLTNPIDIKRGTNQYESTPMDSHFQGALFMTRYLCRQRQAAGHEFPILGPGISESSFNKLIGVGLNTPAVDEIKQLAGIKQSQSLTPQQLSDFIKDGSSAMDALNIVIGTFARNSDREVKEFWYSNPDLEQALLQSGYQEAFGPMEDIKYGYFDVWWNFQVD